MEQIRIPREKSLKKNHFIEIDYQKISEIEKNVFIFREVLNIYYNEYLKRMIITRLQHMNFEQVTLIQNMWMNMKMDDDDLGQLA